MTEITRKADGTWAKGVSGNPAGRAKNDVTAWLERIMREPVEDGSPVTKAEAIARQLVEMTLAGDAKMAEHLLSRIAPKPSRALRVEQPVRLREEPPRIPDTEERRLVVVQLLAGLFNVESTGEGDPREQRPSLEDERSTRHA